MTVGRPPLPVESIPIVLGWNHIARPVVIDLARDAAHIAIQGRTRSGKSQLTYNLLAQCAANPAVRVVGVDPTEVLLRPFRERTPSEPNIELGLRDWDDVMSVLRWVKAESDRRISAFWERRVDKLSVFSPAIPLIVCVLEEFPGIVEGATDFDAASGVKAADRMAPRIMSLVRQIAAQSAKAGVRLLLLAQRMDASVVGGAARSNFGVRCTLRVDEPEAVRMLHPSASQEECEVVARFLPGQGMFEQPGRDRQLIRTVHVGDYSIYARYVEAADLRFEAALGTDHAQRLHLASEYPGAGDVG